ncbi:EthD family reductase [Sphingomonas sp. ASY06-1R]|uniref:EthD family reductase n=1 Tax=Sphingomonas sp. ASY06-1R TaxID=3445771 RepID=UPI003FA2017D
MMITMLVTYAGDAQTPFDRDHWINVHFPLVRESWAPYGLVSADGFFPQGDGAGLIAVAVVNFRDEAAMEAALKSPQTARIMADVDIVTAVKPQRSIVTPF